MNITQMKQALADAKRHERHSTAAETRYWCDQYKILAERLIKAVEEKKNWESHDLYTDADKDRPDVICDSNGSVTLGLCKRCGKGECELSDPCIAATEESSATKESAIKEVVVNADYREMWAEQVRLNQQLCAQISQPKAEQEPKREPLTDEQIVDTFCKAPHQTQYVAWFAAGVRYAEAAHSQRQEN